MTVARVFAHTDVGPHRALDTGLPDRSDRCGHRPIGIPRTAALLVLGIGNPEEHHSSDAGSGRFLDDGNEAIDGQLMMSRHGPDRAGDVGPGDDEQRQHELIGTEGGLRDHGADAGRSAESPGSVCRKGTHRHSGVEGISSDVAAAIPVARRTRSGLDGTTSGSTP